MTGADRSRAYAKAHPKATLSEVAWGANVSRQAAYAALRASPKRGRTATITAGATLEATRARREALLDVPPSLVGLRRINALRLIAILLKRGKAGATVAELIDEIGCSRATLYRLRDDAISADLLITTAAEHGLEGTWRLEAPKDSAKGKRR